MRKAIGPAALATSAALTHAACDGVTTSTGGGEGEWPSGTPGR